MASSVLTPPSGSTSTLGRKSSSTHTTTDPRPQFRLSCSTCRNRKTKCEKRHPCESCTRLGVECVFPTRKPMVRPRRSRNSELLDRINRLEAIVSEADIVRLDTSAATSTKVAETKTGTIADDASWVPSIEACHGYLADSPPVPSDVNSAVPGSVPGPSVIQRIPEKKEAPPGLTRASSSHDYLGKEFWASLCHEVEGLKQMLDHSSDTESEDDGSPNLDSSSQAAKEASSQPSFASQGLLTGFPNAPPMGRLIHPSPCDVEFLVKTYFSNVDMVIKILHRSTIWKMVSLGVTKLTASQTALLFCIYFAAITSLSPAACLSYFKKDRAVLVSFLQSAAERALAAGDYLNNTNLESLQALTIYVACLRSHNASVSSFVLVSLPLRLKQALGMDDTEKKGSHSPFVTEMRRRLSWQILILDVRAAEDRGLRALHRLNALNYPQPLNLNDEDFDEDSKGPLVEREGPTDMTTLLCMAQVSSIFLYIVDASTWYGIDERETMTSQQRQQQQPPKGSAIEEEILEMGRRLEAQFTKNVDWTHGGSLFASLISRLANLKIQLLMQYPIYPSGLPKAGFGPEGTQQRRPHLSRRAILQLAFFTLELQEWMNSSAGAERFGWWGRTYIQWHPLAVSLVELCVQTRGPLVEQTWHAVEREFTNWSRLAPDLRHGNVWRPIRKLYRRAKAAREAALREWPEERSRREAESEAVQSPWKQQLPTSSLSPTSLPAGHGMTNQPMPVAMEPSFSYNTTFLQNLSLAPQPLAAAIFPSTLREYQTSQHPTLGNKFPANYAASDFAPSNMNAQFQVPWLMDTYSGTGEMTNDWNWNVWSEFLVDATAASRDGVESSSGSGEGSGM